MHALTRCLAVQDLTGKAVGIILPISAFAAVGFEHSIANQFLVSAALAT
jgi:formate/nitrite transporter FocA (FNT family)